MEIAYPDPQPALSAPSEPGSNTISPTLNEGKFTNINPPSNPWIPFAPSSAFPNLPPNRRIAAPPPDPWDEVPPSPSPSTPPQEPNCRIYRIDPSNADEHPHPETDKPEILTEITLSEAQLYCSWQPQLLVFRSKGRVWAVQHACPHRGAALSRGRLVDLEDAGGGEGGSVGVVCAVHGWAFELETGMGSKGVDVGVWETREVEGRVWVRKRG